MKVYDNIDLSLTRFSSCYPGATVSFQNQYPVYITAREERVLQCTLALLVRSKIEAGCCTESDPLGLGDLGQLRLPAIYRIVKTLSLDDHHLKAKVALKKVSHMFNDSKFMISKIKHLHLTLSCRPRRFTVHSFLSATPTHLLNRQPFTNP